MDEFALEFDVVARDWLEEHPNPDALVIAYSDTRCCGGGHIRDLRLRRSRRADKRSALGGIGEALPVKRRMGSTALRRAAGHLPVMEGGSVVGMCRSVTSHVPPCASNTRRSIYAP